MTDKIYPGWISDRLPTEKDVTTGSVVVWVGISDRYLRGFRYKNYNHVKKGEIWCNTEDENGKEIDWDDLASPQECVDDECYDKPLKNHPANIQEKKFKDLELENKKLIIDLELFREDEKGYEKEVDYYKNLFELEVDERKVIEGYLEDEHNQKIDLEQALAKSEERVKELEEELSGANQCLKNQYEVSDMFRGIKEKYETFIIKMAKGG